MTGVRSYHFNRYGSYIGYIDEEGSYFLCDGTYRGSLNSKGGLLDENGTLRGHVDVQGQCWGEDGKFLGYLRGPNGLAVRSTPAAPVGAARRHDERRTRAHA